MTAELGAQWRPIETAPRDGTAILVGRRDQAWGFVRGWATYEKIRGIEGWISRGFYDPPSNLGLAHPTHWMPLPAPPDPATAPEEGE